MTLTDTHRQYLLDAAITPKVIDASGITTRTAEPTGIIFPWNDGTMDVPLLQLRPDVPDVDANGRPVKYRFPAESKMILNRLRDDDEGPALIVEGTKQQYTALSYAPEEFAVYGLSGCWNWTDADLGWVMGREIYVLFDGDMTTNKDVYQAAKEFSEQLELGGAESVKFVRTTARGTDGLDDVLAKVAHEKRAQYLALWISKALAKLPKAPPKKELPFFDKDGLQVQQATQHLLEKQPAALTAERKIALYLGGSYHIDGTAFLAAVGKQLGDRFRPALRTAMEEMAIGLLFEGGKLLPERSSFTKLNCSNGMLDLRSLELTPHDPEYMSTIQIPVEWNPEATCPIYEEWLEKVIPLQIEDLEEVCGTMLDPTKTPSKAAFLFGPSRSGKSTLLRLLQEIAGVENRTAVTLHDLSRDRFAAANVYGKMLNSAADLSSAHVEDLSVFKMLTGEDPIHGNRKYGAQFTFTNRALFAFSANELPTVSESSRAYAERIKPFNFPHSFAGREDPTLEPKLYKELPGILVRWVKAYRRVLVRGGYSPTMEAVRKEFDTRSDRIAQWVADVCTITPASFGQLLPAHQATGRRETARAFNQWAERNGGHRMGERKVFDRIGQIPGVVEVRTGRNRDRAFNVVVKDDPNADLGFPEPGPEESIEVRAERADSNHPSHTPTLIPASEKNDLGSKGIGEVHGEGAQKLPVLPADSSASVGFDLETASASQLFLGGHEGPFVRLAGLTEDSQPEGVTGPSAESLIDSLSGAREIYGHTIFGFDLVALAHHHGADYDQLSSKAIDLHVREYLVDPPDAKGGKPNGYYGLDQMAARYGVAGKTDSVKALAKKWGGFDKIPVDDLEYVDYLRGDLAATKAVKDAQDVRIGAMGLTDYAAREMRVAAIQNRCTLNGWAVDTELLRERAEREEQQRAGAVDALRDEFGMPTHEPDKVKLKRKADWSHQWHIADVRALDPETQVREGFATRTPGEPYASPWSTTRGRAALVEAFAAAGARTYPRTPGGDLALSSDALGEKPWYCGKRGESFPGMLQIHGDKPGVRRLVELLNQATGATAKYAEMVRFLTDTGRVHAEVGATQASGRWPYIHPSITTTGKRGAAREQRDVLVADPGHKLIACDLAQLDVRTVAALSQDPELIARLQPGMDYHTEMATIYFGDPARRDDGKPISHGVNYGQGWKAVAERNGLDPDMVREALQARGDTFHVQAAWTEGVRAQAERGELLDNGFGRPMRCDPARAYTQAPALMGQGASRDVMCESLLRLVDLRPDVTPYLRGVIHDEVVLSVPEADVEEWATYLHRAFTWEWKGVPILCDVSAPAYRWSDCK